MEVLVSPLAEETRVGKSHYTWAHRNEVVPDRAPAAMGAKDENRGFHERSLTRVIPRSYLAEKSVLAAFCCGAR